MQINIFSGKIAKLRSEMLVVSCFEDVRPLGGLAGEIDWLYGGIFSSLMMQNRMTGKLGELLLLAAQDKLQVPKIILVGLGMSASYGYPQLNTVAENLYRSINGLNVRERAVELFVPAERKLDLILLMESFLNGWHAGSKGMGEKKDEPFDLTFVVKQGEGAKRLQQKILNGEYLREEPYSVGAESGTGARSGSFH